MPLTYRDSGVSGTQITVFSGELAIAILWKRKGIADDDWRWTFTLTAGPSGFQHNGKAPTKDEAMVCLERNWRAWLDSAALCER